MTKDEALKLATPVQFGQMRRIRPAGSYWNVGPKDPWTRKYKVAPEWAGRRVMILNVSDDHQMVQVDGSSRVEPFNPNWILSCSDLIDTWSEKWDQEEDGTE